MNMHRILLPAVLLALAGPVSAANACTIAAIWRDGGVTIDWKCVEARAAEWKIVGANNLPIAWAHTLKAIHEGDSSVVMDWASVDIDAAKWKPGLKGSTASWAYVLKAVHDGKVL